MSATGHRERANAVDAPVSDEDSPQEATLRVWRGTGADGDYQQFSVPYQEGMSVLDGLIWIRRNEDASLAFRYSCISANACKECSAKVDGQVTYLCTARLHEGTVTVEPLPKRRLIRDLVTDIIGRDEKVETQEENSK